MIATKVDPDVAVKSAKKMTAGRTRIVFDRPLYSPILFKLDFKPAPWVPTMCTDGRSLMYNPKFSIDLTVDHLMFCILHGTMHCVFRHCARRGNRDPQLWNIAGDISINNILIYEEKLSYPNWVLHDRKFMGMSTEQIYDELAADRTAAQAGPLQARPAVTAALDALRGDNAWTLRQQVELCQIPAPTNQEARRAAEFRRRMQLIGYTDTRLDEMGNVIAELPGTSRGGPRVVLGAHLDTVFPDSVDVTASRVKAPATADRASGTIAADWRCSSPSPAPSDRLSFVPQAPSSSWRPLARKGWATSAASGS